MGSNKTAVIDLDGTIVHCQIEYLRVRQKGAEYIESITGMPHATANKLIGHIDLINIEHTSCFTKSRYPTSFKSALTAAAVLCNTFVLPRELEAMYNIGNSVFSAEYPLRPNAVEFLKGLREKEFSLLLLTKGDPEVQNYKIEKHGLRCYFDNIKIVSKKCPDTFKSCVEEFGIHPATSISVGDSLKDDIYPASHNKIRTFLIASDDSKWSYNEYDVKASEIVQSLEQVLDFV